MRANSAEYIGMMNYLSNSGASLLDIVLSSDRDYVRYKQIMFGHSQSKYFESVLDRARQLILAGKPGSNTVRYLLHTMNNKVLKLQRSDENNIINNAIHTDRSQNVGKLIGAGP